MDRCAIAYKLHHEGYNCAQAVVGAFEDRIGLPQGAVLTAAGGFGGGLGGSHEEMCGAASGGVMALSLLAPYTGERAEVKRRVYALCKDFRRRFAAVFGVTRCGDLLAARPGVTDKTPAAQRLGLDKHCDILIVTAVELVEAMLEEIAP